MNLDKSSEGFMSIAIVTQQLLKAVLETDLYLVSFLSSIVYIVHLAVRFPIPGVCLVFALSEGPPAVGADEAFRVEFIS